MTNLSVNLNKVALVRNTRQLGIPSVTHAAVLCLQAGAQGITVHPRPDARHIRSQDVWDLAKLMQSWPDREYNIEGNPHQNLMEIVRALKSEGLPVHQCTLVPDSAGQFTSDHGWNLAQDGAQLQPLIAEIAAMGVRVSLFMDAVPEAQAQAKELGAQRVELYTEPWAMAWGTQAQSQVLAQFSAASQAAANAGLGVNAGHDLNTRNLKEFLAACPAVQEVSIGHAFIADALEFGYTATTKNYLQCIAKATAA